MSHIRVLIADDSATMCSIISSFLRREPQIEVVGFAVDGQQAVAMAESLAPDVITMDVQMPLMGGLEAIERIMRRAPSRILAVCSVQDQEVDLSFRAIAAGALELIAKPVAGPGYDLNTWGKKLVEAVRLMAEVPVIRRGIPSFVERGPSSRRGSVDAIGIAASTGGPQALVTILAGLSATLPVPILIAQHMSSGFVNGFVRWLQQVTPLKVVLPKSGNPCLPGHIYLPPDGHDLSVDRKHVLAITRSSGLYCPSADRLLTSVAQAYGSRAAGLVLTGMGEDGALGLLAIRVAGGVTLAQDEESSVVYGMPRAAVERGATKLQLPLPAIAKELTYMAFAPGMAGLGGNAR